MLKIPTVGGVQDCCCLLWSATNYLDEPFLLQLRMRASNERLRARFVGGGIMSSVLVTLSSGF